MITIIAAIDKNNGIGKGNKLLCHLPSDLKRFKKLTTGNTVVMGRKTFESIGKALPNRVNTILSRKGNTTIDLINDNRKDGVYIIGGEQVYNEFIDLVDRLEITHIYAQFEADKFFPVIGSEWAEVAREDHEKDDKHAYNYSFVTYERK